jgi:hypothetical protein
MKMKSNVAPIEHLESRIAPAGIITFSADKRTATWDDVDGDKVTLKITKGELADILFTTDQTPTTGLLVEAINLTDVKFKGTAVTVTSSRGPVTGGDNSVNIGYINAVGQPLGAVSIAGDLGRIDAGDPVLTPKTPKAIASLKVQSMGALDGETLPTGITQVSEIVGKVGPITVRGDVKGILFNVTGDAAGSIDALTIGGSLVGTDDGDSGRFSTTGAIGAIVIKGSILGSTGQNSGSIQAGGSIKSLTINGSIFGGRSEDPSTEGTGVVRTELNLGAVSISGSIHGGTQQGSGLLSAAGNLSSVKILGGIIGGSAGTTSGGILAGGGATSISIKGDLLGNGAEDSGIIRIDGKVGTLSVLGAVTGGLGEGSGRIQLGTDATDTVGTLTIGRDLTGGGVDAGVVQTAGKVTTLTIKGSVHGLAGTGGGSLLLDGGVGTLSIVGDVIGGTVANTGQISLSGPAAKIAISGSLLGGTGNYAGAILSNALIGSLSITGDVLGGDLASAALADVTGSGLIQAGTVGTLTVGGALVAGADYNAVFELVNNASIRVVNSVGTLTVKGGIEGNAETPIFITARGQETLPLDTNNDYAFGAINVGVVVRHATILAGYTTLTDVKLAESNPNAQIKTVVVKGDWVASSLVAGAKWNDNFGDGTDVIATGLDNIRITARFDSVSILGQIIGTAGVGTDHYGFVTQAVLAMSVGKLASSVPGKNSISLTLGKGNDNDPVSLRYNLASTLDVRLFEFV